MVHSLVQMCAIGDKKIAKQNFKKSLSGGHNVVPSYADCLAEQIE